MTAQYNFTLYGNLEKARHSAVSSDVQFENNDFQN